MQTKVQKWGNSLALRIPKSCALDSHMVEGTVVEVSVRGGELVVVPVVEREYTLEELLAGVTDENRHADVDFGPPVGKELL